MAATLTRPARSGRVKAALPCGHGDASLDPRAAGARRRCPVDGRSWSVETSIGGLAASFTERVAT